MNSMTAKFSLESCPSPANCEDRTELAERASLRYYIIIIIIIIIIITVSYSTSLNYDLPRTCPV